MLEEVLLEIRVCRDHSGGVNESVTRGGRGKRAGCNSTSLISALQLIFLSYSRLGFCSFSFGSAAV